MFMEGNVFSIEFVYIIGLVLKLWPSCKTLTLTKPSNFFSYYVAPQGKNVKGFYIYM